SVAPIVHVMLHSFPTRRSSDLQPQQESLQWLHGQPIGQYVVVGLAMVILAPLVEELFFRGYVFNAYLKSKGPITAYIATSLAFRSEEHTSELQSRENLVCRLLL